MFIIGLAPKPVFLLSNQDIKAQNKLSDKICIFDPNLKL